jgi:hypothetical protein
MVTTQGFTKHLVDLSGSLVGGHTRPRPDGFLATDFTNLPQPKSTFDSKKGRKKIRGNFWTPGFLHFFTMTYYQPYSPEWHRLRHLKEALDKYLDDYVDTQVILDDIDSILEYRSQTALDEYTRVQNLQDQLRN